MTDLKVTNIPHRQRCINKEHPYTSGARDIYDDEKEKSQEQVNKDVDAAFENHQEQINNEKQRAEGVESGLNNRLGTVEQLAEISIGGGDAQIATGADFTNPDATKRAKVPTVGAIVDGLNDGVYDVSKRNPTAGPNSDGKFTLDYILSNADTLIPTGFRHGGMIISFVDSSDNKYVQYRLMSNTFSTTESNWQGVDKKPVSRSRNLIESGGVEDKVNESTIKSGNCINILKNRTYNHNGEVVGISSSWSASPLIDVDDILNTSILLSQSTTGIEGSDICSVVYFDSSKNVVGYGYSNTTTIQKSSLTTGVKYVAFSFYEKDSVSLSDYFYDDKINKLHVLHNNNKSSIDAINEEIGIVENYPSTLSVNSSSTQYLCSDIAVDADVIKLLVTTDAIFVSGKKLYYNIQYGDGSWKGEASVIINNEYTIDSNGKKFKDISIYCPKNSIETGGSANVRITTAGLKRDIFDIDNHLEKIDGEIAELQPSSKEYWVSDNLWDESDLYKGYLWSNSQTGNFVSNSNWRMTNYLVPVNKGDKISVFKKGTDASVAANYVSTYIAEYDSNKSFIHRNEIISGSIYTVPDGVAYIRMSVFTDKVEGSWSLYSYVSNREHYLRSDLYPPYGVYPIRKGTKMQNRKIVYFGDSIICNGNVDKYVKMMTGAEEVYNVGFGGCRMCAHGDDPDWNCFSMYKLADAIVANNYSYQDEGFALMGGAANYPNHALSLSTLKTIDFSEVDVILIHYGTNDWTSGAINIGTGDKSNNRDFKGMIAYIIETILTAYPQIRIIFDYITYRHVPVDGFVTGDNIFTAVNSKGNTLIDFNDAIKDVCEDYLIQYNDLFNGLYNKYNESVFLQDGVHPNDKGWRLMAERVANLL